MGPADKALALAGRYARLRLRDHQCRKLTSRLFDMCEDPAYHGEEKVGSGCMVALREAKADGAFKYGPDGESNWYQVLSELDFCRPCRIGLAVWRHRKQRLARRRSSVLAALSRIGRKMCG